MANEFKVSTDISARLDLIDRVLANRTVQSGSSSTVGILLHGDPGTGKTSFVRALGHLFGVELVVIEAPHITEEHIINIPFITFADDKSSGTKGNQKAEVSGPKIVLADSHLYSTLRRATVVPDAQLLRNIYGGHDQSIKIWEALGGNNTTIPKGIAKFRASAKVILFIDEYFRQPSPRIKNILRGILNGKLGMHDLPSDAYVIYASNLRDEGVGPMAANNDFEQIELETPNKDEWFSWLVNKFKDTEVDLNTEVIKKFHKLLSQEHLSHHDLDADVRTSPRSWEQLLLYINASIPPKDEKAAKSLITNIRTKFTNYKTGEQSAIAAGVVDAVSQLIKDSSGMEVSTAGNKSDEWRSTLEHQIETKMKLGKARTYIPIVSGPPGIGKTSEMARAAKDLDLRYIYVDCSTLDPEMTMGIPVSENPSGKDGDDKIKVKFSSPQLYQQIMDDIAKEDAAHVEKLSPAEKKAYAKKKYKYMIFFDEMNRTSVKVFNGLRRVLLEKDFGHGLELPDEALMVAAINPSDIGTQDLTLHMRDVVDIIDSQPNWKKTKQYIDALKVDVSPTALKTAKNTIVKMLDTMKDTNSARPADQRQFYMNMGDTPLYISPREIVSMISNTAANLDLKLERLKPEIESEEPERVQKALEILTNACYTSIKGTLDNVIHKQQVDASEFLHDLKQWVNTNFDVEGIFVKKAQTQKLADVLDPYFKDPKKDITKQIELINYIEGHDLQEFKEELAFYLQDILEADHKHFTKREHPKMNIADGKLSADEKALVSRAEQLLRGIILSLKVNKVSGEMFDGVKFGVRDALKLLIAKAEKGDDEDLVDEALALNMSITKLISAK